TRISNRRHAGCLENRAWGRRPEIVSPLTAGQVSPRQLAGSFRGEKNRLTRRLVNPEIHVAHLCQLPKSDSTSTSCPTGHGARTSQPVAKQGFHFDMLLRCSFGRCAFSTHANPSSA